MSKKRLLIILGVVGVLAVVGGLVLLLPRGAAPVASDTGGVAATSPAPATTTPTQPTLSSENVEVLQKLNSPDKSERLRAFAPLLHNDSVEQVVAANTQAVEILPDTFAVFDTYATVDAKMAGQVITFYLAPSGGLWLITGQK